MREGISLATSRGVSPTLAYHTWQQRPRRFPSAIDTLLGCRPMFRSQRGPGQAFLSASERPEPRSPPPFRGPERLVGDRRVAPYHPPGLPAAQHMASSPCSRWWAEQGSNLRPQPCKGCALPAELSARVRRRRALILAPRGLAPAPPRVPAACKNCPSPGHAPTGRPVAERPRERQVRAPRVELELAPLAVGDARGTRPGAIGWVDWPSSGARRSPASRGRRPSVAGAGRATLAGR